jgi:hypothetical protein
MIPIFWRQVGRKIGEVSKLCHELGLPLISVKVVGKGRGTAGAGFYPLFEMLGMDTHGKSENELFSQELKNVRECKEWYRLADYLGLDLDIPRPSAVNDDNESGGITPTEPLNVEHLPVESTAWIFPSSIKTYDVIGAFCKFKEIDWHQSVRCKIGDTVYIYCAIPYKRIMYKTKVVAKDISAQKSIDDSEFWASGNRASQIKGRIFLRLQLVNQTDSDILSLVHLLEHGLKAAPQGPQRVSADIMNYIDKCFSDYAFDPRLPEELPEHSDTTYTEGLKKQIMINAYERNPTARYECIKTRGTQCAVCGFDFGTFYGDEFAGKIHIHHVTPLYLIDETYEINPLTDLIPVCPNCHMALHSKPGGVYTVDELKDIIAKQRLK